MIAIINGSVITMEGTDYHRGTVLMEGDKIVAVGTEDVYKRQGYHCVVLVLWHQF